MSRSPAPDAPDAREPITRGDLAAAEHATARRMKIYAAVILGLTALLLGSAWLESLAHG